MTMRPGSDSFVAEFQLQTGPSDALSIRLDSARQIYNRS